MAGISNYYSICIYVGISGLFCFIGGGYYSRTGPLKAPPLAEPKNHQKPKNLQSNSTIFLSRFGFSLFGSS